MPEKRGLVRERIIRILLNNPGGDLTKYRIAKLAKAAYSWTHDFLRDLENGGLVEKTRVTDYRELASLWREFRTVPDRKEYMVQSPLDLLKSAGLRYALTTYAAENLVQKHLFQSRGSCCVTAPYAQINGFCRQGLWIGVCPSLSMVQKRRDGCRVRYHRAHVRGPDFLTNILVFLVTEGMPRPEPGRSGRGGPDIVHSRAKTGCVYLLMVSMGMTSRDTECLLPYPGLPWGGPVPDHTTMARHLGRIPADWPEGATARIARMCPGEAGWRRPMAAADSTGAGTDRYGTAVRPDRNRRGFAPKRIRTCPRWHVLAMPELKVILASRITPGSTGDSLVLPKLLATAKRLGVPLEGSPFCADKGYDSEANCGAALRDGMIPHISQRAGAASRGRPHRSRAARLFDADTYRYRGMIEGIFGAEESEGHGLHCRFRKAATRRRFGLTRAIGWNIEALNRIRTAKETGMEVRQYVR